MEIHEKFWKNQRKGIVDITVKDRIDYISKNLKKSDKILDIGCGNGFLMSKIMEKKKVDIIGMDISKTALRYGRKKYPNIPTLQGDCMKKYPFKDNQFDVVYMSELIEHLPDFSMMFEEIKRVLKPDGKLIVITPYHNTIKNLIIALFYFEGHYDPEGHHVRFFTLKSINKLFEKNGFRYVSHKLIGRINLFARDMAIIYKLNLQHKNEAISW